MKIRFAFLLLFCIFLLPACNSRDDVKCMSEKDVIKYVKAAIDEDISLVSTSTDKKDRIIYEFKLKDRDATFKATSVVDATFLDGTQLGNFKEKIYIDYEAGIAESEHYTNERSRIAQELNIDYKDYEYGLGTATYVKNYTDIDKVAQFIVKLDNLYEFKEKKPERIKHIDSSSISFSDPASSIGGPDFSANKKTRLKYNDVYNNLVHEYIVHLKKFGLKDNTIPQDIWEKNN